jgi:D-alanine-D-alanine ligase
MMIAYTYRQQIQHLDLEAITRIVQSSGFFSMAEIDLALELAQDKLTHGAASSYQFLLGEDKDFVWGYTCFGLIPATAGSFDLYWIAVDQHLRTQGLGRELMTKTEEIIRASGGKHIYAETSSRNQYLPTQTFYLRCGYQQEAFLKDFYATGDSKIIYSKSL